MGAMMMMLMRIRMWTVRKYDDDHEKEEYGWVRRMMMTM